VSHGIPFAQPSDPAGRLDRQGRSTITIMPSWFRSQEATAVERLSVTPALRNA
jgi:hypothetical protein